MAVHDRRTSLGMTGTFYRDTTKETLITFALRNGCMSYTIDSHHRNLNKFLVLSQDDLLLKTMHCGNERESYKEIKFLFAFTLNGF